jgi:hypothetical protein
MESRRGLNTNPSRYPPHSLQAILADLETNTRAGYTLRKPARKSRRAVRIEKSTALTVFRHSSSRELQMLHTLGHYLKRSSARLVELPRQFIARR